MIPARYLKANGKVDIWDMGPQVAPKAPLAPPEPDKMLKGAELAAAQLEYEDACEAYKDDLRAYSAARKEHRRWGEENGGPVKVEMWSVDASHALEIEKDRYCLELPKGKKPGTAQIEAEKRAAVEADELNRLREQDPQFGRGAAPQ